MTPAKRDGRPSPLIDDRLAATARAALDGLPNGSPKDDALEALATRILQLHYGEPS